MDCFEKQFILVLLPIMSSLPKLKISLFFYLLLLGQSLFSQNVIREYESFANIQCGDMLLSGSYRLVAEPNFVGGPYLKAKYEDFQITYIEYKGRSFSADSRDYVINELNKFITFPYQVTDKTIWVGMEIYLDLITSGIDSTTPFPGGARFKFETNSMVGRADNYESEEAEDYFEKWDDISIRDNEVWEREHLIYDVTTTSISANLATELAQKLDPWITKLGKKSFEQEARDLMSKARSNLLSNAESVLKDGIDYTNQALTAASKSGNQSLYYEVKQLQTEISNKLSDVRTRKWNEDLARKQREFENKYKPPTNTNLPKTQEQVNREFKQSYDNAINSLASLIVGSEEAADARRQRESDEYMAKYNEQQRISKLMYKHANDWYRINRKFCIISPESSGIIKRKF